MNERKTTRAPSASAKRKAALTLAGRRAVDFAFSRKCVLCGEAMPLFRAGELCPECVPAYAKREAMRCPVCRRDVFACACSQLRTQNLGANVAALGFYDGAEDAVGRMIYKFKRDGSRDLTRFFARSLAARILRVEGLAAAEAVVTYPPRSLSAVWRYGFDHAKELARMTAYFLGADYERTLVRLGGSEQKKLDSAGRAKNAAGAFALRPAIARRQIGGRSLLEGRRVILVDDVATTGATLAEAASVLKAAGAADVRFAVLFLTASKAPDDGGALWFEDDADGEPIANGDPLADDVGF